MADSSADTRAEPAVRPIDPAVLLIVLMWLPLVALAVRSLASPAQPQATPAVQDRLDPNVAPWWELSALPQIGIASSRAIVRFREEAMEDASTERVFSNAVDLERVRGIGPRTVLRIAPYLHFGGR